MTDQECLLRAILADPADDAPRLAYADWLTENGQADRAEFVRVQCELARRRNHDVSTQLHGLKRCCGCGPKQICDECVDLRRRERELWAAVREVIRSEMAERWPGQWCIHIDSLGQIAEDATAAIVRRGFVAEVRCTTAAFVGGTCDRCGIYQWQQRHPGISCGLTCETCDSTGRTPGVAADLFRRHPVERVTLTDREPMRWRSESGSTLFGDSWWFAWRRVPSPQAYPGEGGSPSHLPTGLAPALWARHADKISPNRMAVNFNSAAAARAALSAGCCRYGREAAGLGVTICGESA